MSNVTNSNTIKYFINKLVRDLIKNVVDKDVSLTLKKATQIKYIIIRKLIEELEELQQVIFHHPSHKYNILDELVDVFEVLLKIIQIWNNDYRFYSLNEIITTILQHHMPVEETKPLFIVRKMYKIAVDLLKMSNESNTKRIEQIDLLCNYFTALLHKLNIKFHTLIAARIGKQKYRGIFNNNLILTHVEMPTNHRLIYYYDKYKVVK